MKFRKILLALLISFFSGQLRGQTLFKLNEYNIIDDGRIIPVMTLFSAQSFNERWGMAAYFYLNGAKGSSWGQGLAGPTWVPVKGLTLGLLAGFQSNEDQLWRVSPIINFTSERLSGFAVFEYGGKRHRWDAMVFYLIRNFKLGGEFIRFFGMYAAGPRVEFSFVKKQKITLFYSQLWDFTHTRPSAMIGIYTSFGQKK